VFGNSHDKESDIYKVRENNKQRGFYVLEQLHVLPNITYLAKVRNTDEEDKHWGGHHEEGEAKETMPAATKPEETTH
jgi:molybdopterin-containing oxidoreductase family iron-sulfur binding subunit